MIMMILMLMMMNGNIDNINDSWGVGWARVWKSIGWQQDWLLPRSGRCKHLLSVMYCNDDDGDVDENDDKEKEGEQGYEDGKEGKDEEKRTHRGVFFIEFEFRVFYDFAFLIELSLLCDKTMAENDVCK